MGRPIDKRDIGREIRLKGLVVTSFEMTCVIIGVFRHDPNYPLCFDVEIKENNFDSCIVHWVNRDMWEVIE